MEDRSIFNKLYRLLVGIETAVGPLILLIILIDVCLQVISRTLPGNAIPWTVELGEILLGALVWLGISRGVAQDSHISFDLLTRRFPLRWKRILDIWNASLFILYLVLLGIFTIQLLSFYQKLSAKSTILRIGMFWVRLPILIGCVATSIRLVFKEIELLKKKNVDGRNVICR